MSAADDWQFDYVGNSALEAQPTFQHIDGVLAYDTNTGTAPSLGDYVRGTNSGAVAKVIGGTDLGGTAASGSLTVTNVVGLFEDNDPLEVLSTLEFDVVTPANGGFDIGDVLDDTTTARISVRAIEYNIGSTQGLGVVHGDTFTTGFANNDQININGGQADVADVAANAATDNSGLFTTAQTSAQLVPPGTANTNDAIIVHYDAGSEGIPTGAKIADATTGAFGKAQRIYGDDVTGSVYIVNSDTTGGAWTDDNNLEVQDVVNYDTLVAGKVWQAGDVGRGATSLVEFRVLKVIDDGDNTGRLILAGDPTVFTNGENLDRLLSDDTYENVAAVENLTAVLNVAVLNLPDGVIDTQQANEGGIYGAGSLNIIRDLADVYSYVKGNMDDLLQLDDKSIMDGQVLSVAYTTLDPWKTPTPSWRFVMRGGVQDEAGNEILTNIETAGTMFNVGNHGFLRDATNPTPQQELYIEQDGAEVPQFWLKGHINVLVTKRSNRLPKYIDGNVDGLGQNIAAGLVTVHGHDFGATYSSADNEVVAATVSPVFVATKTDANNASAQYRHSFNTGGAGAFTIGEEIESGVGNTYKVGIVVASGTGATGDVDFIMKAGALLTDSDVITGVVSGKSATLDVAGGSTLVAGYGTNIKTMTVQVRLTGGTTTVATYILGELVTQAGSGATGYFMEDDAGDIYLEHVSGTFNNSGQLSAPSGSLNTPTGVNDQASVPKDIGDGVDNNYTAVTTADLTDASPQPVLSAYEWHKFINRRESTELIAIAGAQTSGDTLGKFFRKFGATFAESAENAHGSFAGGKYFGSQGHFIDKDSLAIADLQNIELRDNAFTKENPPNLQPITMTGLAVDIAAAVYRSTGVDSTTILTGEFQIGAGNASGDSDIVLQAGGARGVSPLPNDVPNTGVLMIEDPSNPGIFLIAIYDSVNRATNTFDLQQGIGQNTIGDITGAVALTQTDDAFVAFFVEQATGASISNTVEYVADINLVGVARKKGKKPFEGVGVFTNTGGSIGAVFNNDPGVNLP